MTKLTVLDVPHDRLERLMATGTIVPPEALDHMAEQLGPDSPPAMVKKEIAGTKVLPGMIPLVVLDNEDEALVLMWAVEAAPEDQK